jgi:SAM-dependent methyltransferase
MSSRALSPPKVSSAAAAAGLRDLFDGAGFVIGGAQRLLRATDDSLARRRDLPAHLRRLGDDDSPLAVLVKLFILNVPVDENAYERALGAAASLVADCGLAETASGEVKPLVRIVPHERFWITSDIEYLEAHQADHVAGVHRPSATLARLTVRRDVARSLDVGTGNGIQALLLSDHSERVVATDVNERALAFAEFNAALNGVTNVEWRAGSFLDPVAGEQFGVVASNPPYVISPESEYIFRDSGMGRDRVSEELVRALPAVLEDDGYATVMVSWIAESDDDDAARPRGWVEGLDVSALVVHSHAEDALQSAVIWNQNRGSDDEINERVERWMTYYESERIGALAYGAIVMRKGSPRWVRALALPSSDRFTAASEQLQRVFRTYDFLETQPDILAQQLRFPEEVTLEQRLAPSDEGWSAKGMTLTLGRGLGFEAALDASSARIVTELAAAPTVGDALDAVARELGTDPVAFRRTAEPLIRRLLEFGYLVLPA